VEDMNVSTDFADKLNEETIALIQKAVKRARENARRTVMARDL
jgi:histone H3/H4